MRILRTPPDILIEFLKTWDKIAAEEGGEEPVLQEGARLAARVRVGGGAGEALLLPAVLVRGQLLLARKAARSRRREGGGQEEVAGAIRNGGGQTAPVLVCKGASEWLNRRRA